LVIRAARRKPTKLLDYSETGAGLRPERTFFNPPHRIALPSTAFTQRLSARAGTTTASQGFGPTIIRTTTGHLSSIPMAATLRPSAAILRDRAVRNIKLGKRHILQAFDPSTSLRILPKVVTRSLTRIVTPGKRESRAVSGAQTLDARLRGHDEKAGITYAAFATRY
jgi:hypothetical protein